MNGQQVRKAIVTHFRSRRDCKSAIIAKTSSREGAILSRDSEENKRMDASPKPWNQEEVHRLHFRSQPPLAVCKLIAFFHSRSMRRGTLTLSKSAHEWSSNRNDNWTFPLRNPRHPSEMRLDARFATNYRGRKERRASVES